MILIFLDSDIHVHDVDTASLITVRVLNQQEVAVFVGQIQIVGIKCADFFLGHENIALVPMITVRRRIENEALDATRSAVQNVYAVNESNLRIANA